MNRTQYNRIQEVLEEKGKDVYWLQTQLKDETIPNVVRWSKNVKQPTIEVLFEIAQVLDVDVRELLVDSTNLQSPHNEQMKEDYYVKQYGMTKEEYIDKYFNKVNTLTAICRSTSTWAHGEYQELEIGKTYHVSYIGVLRSSSNIMLDNYGDKVYNAGCFDLCENGEPIGRKYTKDPRFLAPYLREMMRVDRYPYFEKEIEKIAIPAHLRSIEKEYDVRILLAVDFGSRAWGVESKDSDWDIRLVYVHKPEWYQKNGQRDVIEHVYENCIDVLGWDIKKALTLLKHGNLSLLEWLNSPKAYYVDEDFAKRIHSVEKDLFNSANAIRYYSHFYEKNNESILQNDLCETKLFLYILRGILSCKWIKKNNSLPPILLNELIETTIDDLDIKNKLNTIIKKKKEGKDDGIVILAGFIRQLADKYKVRIEPFLPIDDRSVEALDSLLLDTIQGEQNCDREPFSIQKNNSIEILSYFQGKENVRHIISDNGNVSWLTQERSFADEAYAKGACKLNTLENETKHVLFLFNQNDEEVGRYYLGKKLQGKTPEQLVEIKHGLVFFESWNPETKKWVPCVTQLTTQFIHPHLSFRNDQKPPFPPSYSEKNDETDMPLIPDMIQGITKGNKLEMILHVCEIDINAIGKFQKIEEEIWTIGDKYINTPHGSLRVNNVIFVDKGQLVGVQFTVTGKWNLHDIDSSNGIEYDVEINTFALMRQPNNAWLWVYAFDCQGKSIVNFCGYDDLDSFAKFISSLKQLIKGDNKISKSEWGNNPQIYGKWYSVQKSIHPVLNTIDYSLTVECYNEDGTMLKHLQLGVKSLNFSSNLRWGKYVFKWKTKNDEILITNEELRLKEKMKYDCDNGVLTKNNANYYRTLEDAIKAVNS